MDPSEDFVSFFAKMVTGSSGKKILESFTPIVRISLEQYINDKIQERLKKALQQTDDVQLTNTQAETPQEGNITVTDIETTEDEYLAFYIVKAMLLNLIPADKIVLKDQKTKCSVLYEGKQTKPIIFFFNK